MKVLHVHAHFDDFEFCSAGTFERWRRELGSPFTGRVLVCTDGRAGHQRLSRAETGRIRLAEQAASAQLGGYEFSLLSHRNGEPFAEGCRVLTSELLEALWLEIRAFEPDYLICPPLPSDPLAGVHPDHWTVAEAVRRIAYMINVPHAFPDPSGAPDDPSPRWLKTPVILNTYDAYQAGANQFDLAVDVESCFELIASESWCHQSQIREWLPWVGRHSLPVPAHLDDWHRTLRQRFERQARELELPSDRAWEVFVVTAWGSIPTAEQLARDFPGLDQDAGRLHRLETRLKRWQST
jgi:LmbE family N-acetylglucosaminyl deacetylase